MLLLEEIMGILSRNGDAALCETFEFIPPAFGRYAPTQDPIIFLSEDGRESVTCETSIQEKALNVIEILASESEGENQDSAIELLGKIYKFAHIATNPSCLSKHNSWLNELNLLFDRLIKEF